ncbi:transcriptional regulator [Candidatus Parcubacteria bacterium]|nr:transcriptional regulator [Candidatus Parcubacteria bacterium]
MPKSINFKEYLIESLKDPKEASAYLDVALEEFEKDGDMKTFLLMLRDVTEAQGGFSELARKTSLNRQNLYRVLSGKGNPRISTLGSILNGLGFRFSIKANC